VTLATMGLSLFGIGAVRLPRWARLRRRQMEGVAERLTHDMKSLPVEGRPSEEC